MHCMQMFRDEIYQPKIPHRCWEHHCLSALLLLWSGWWWWSGMRNANTETSGSMMWLCVQVVRWRGNIITEIQLPAGRAPAIFIHSCWATCALQEHCWSWEVDFQSIVVRLRGKLGTSRLEVLTCHVEFLVFQISPFCTIPILCCMHCECIAVESTWFIIFFFDKKEFAKPAAP